MTTKSDRPSKVVTAAVGAAWATSIGACITDLVILGDGTAKLIAKPNSVQRRQGSSASEVVIPLPAKASGTWDDRDMDDESARKKDAPPTARPSKTKPLTPYQHDDNYLDYQPNVVKTVKGKVVQRRAMTMRPLADDEA